MPRKKPPARPLTQRQLSFCQYIVDGDKHCEAYIKAGYASAGARANSTILIAKHSIKTEIARLRAQIDTPKLLTRALIRQKRAEIALDKDTKNQDALAALRDDAKMMGYDAPDKIDISHDVKITWGRDADS